jgi:hypothetical protein
MMFIYSALYLSLGPGWRQVGRLANCTLLALLMAGRSNLVRDCVYESCGWLVLKDLMGFQTCMDACQIKCFDIFGGSKIHLQTKKGFYSRFMLN